MSWIDVATSGRSAARLRTDLIERYPVFASGALKEMVLIGAAAEGERMCRIASDRGVRVLAVIDDDPGKRGRLMPGGTTVLPALPREIDGETPVVIASHRVVDATLRMQRNGCRNALAAGVLQTLDPDRFPPHPFYENWLEDISDSSDKYRQVYDLLADERSRAIFDALLGYRISGDARQLAPFVDRNIFYPTELFRFTE